MELYDEFCQSLCENGKKQLREFVMNNAHDGIQPELAVHDRTAAADSIVSFAQARKAEIVMGTHGRRA